MAGATVLYALEPTIAADDTVYLAARSVFAFTSDGKPRWQFTPETIYCNAEAEPTSLSCSPMLGQDGTLYFTTGDGQLYAVSSSGTPLWRDRGERFDGIVNLFFDADHGLEATWLRPEPNLVKARQERVVYDARTHGGLMQNAWPMQSHDPGHSSHRPLGP